jgi:DNA-binding transcriptional MerR regulator
MRDIFMTDTDQHMTIREMCDAFDVTARTLRFYESKELLFPIRQGTRRLFTKKDRARLTLILRAKRFNFSLEEIRQLLDLYDPASQNLTQSLRAIEIGKEHLAEMISKRDALNEAIVDLEEQLKWGEHMVRELTQPDAAVS